MFVDQKTYKPWRFDTPRNDSMKLVPEDTDIYFCTDLDELLEPGWYDDIQSNWDEDTNRGSYVYAWSHTESGDVARTFWYDKIHTKGFK